MAALNPSTRVSRASRRDATSIGAAILAAVIFGFVALVLASVMIGLAVAVSLADSGRITIKPTDLAMARDALGWAWLIGLAGIVNLAGLFGVLSSRRFGATVAMGVAGAGFGLATGLWLTVLTGGATADGLGISLAAMGTYAVALAAAMVVRFRQPA